MNEQQKTRNAAPRIRDAWRDDDIVGDVFELWMGISRLMDRISRSDQVLDAPPMPPRGRRMSAVGRTSGFRAERRSERLRRRRGPATR